jgi:ribulose-5-phosphate 4-epimerase/fuculose-1-phosphate aldolase
MEANEGYIKYKCKLKKQALIISEDTLASINTVRKQLIKQSWLGVLPNGIGFGNISIRTNDSDQFLITGSATGELTTLNASHLAMVEHTDINKNQLSCCGLCPASSESLSHAAFYAFDKTICAVIHIHDRILWTRLIDQLPCSNINAQYGTPEMAKSLTELLSKTQKSSGVMVMEGHQDGLIAYGHDLNQTLGLLIEKSLQTGIG